MTKQEVQQRVLLNGKVLDLDKFSWDEKTNTFSSNMNFLVLDFHEINNCTFDTGDDCTFKTYSNCTFKTYYDCTFETRDNCTFKTGAECVCVRRDVFEFFEIPTNVKIKLNDYETKGYTLIEE